MTLLPFEVSDVVVYLGEAGTVVSVRGERIAVEVGGQVYVTTEGALRRMQPKGAKRKDGLG